MLKKSYLKYKCIVLINTMNPFICVLCNYKTDRSSNLVRHFESKRHKDMCYESDKKIIPNKNLATESHQVVTKTNTITTVKKKGVYVCKVCGKNFDDKYSKYKHQKKCIDTQPIVSQTTIIKNIENSDMLKILLKQLEEKDKQIENFQKSMTKVVENSNENSRNVGRTLNMLSYARTNFSTAPALKSLEQDQVCEIINYGGSLNSPEDIEEYCKEVLYQYHHKKLPSYFGVLISTYFNKVTFKQRQVWATDVSRLSFIVMKSTGVGNNDEKEWVTDKSGKKFAGLVISPLFETVKMILEKYIKYGEAKAEKLYSTYVNTNTRECERHMERMKRARELIRDINLNEFEKEILKFIAPFFNFDLQKASAADNDFMKKLDVHYNNTNDYDTSSDTSDSNSEKHTIKPIKKVARKSTPVDNKSSEEISKKIKNIKCVSDNSEGSDSSESVKPTKILKSKTKKITKTKIKSSTSLEETVSVKPTKVNDKHKLNYSNKKTKK